ncbi:hypothetical protein [Geobacter sp. DSM 9736]|uniref:hypothetical protein n=1 Tax=Geobacter sp. DSM 9736 TaxID=1277350 RepID=UPI000B5FB910|nr:hypothetical protein [Geobacter sp. DSM 9736]SNB47528.1 Autotransporter translocation and assembly factor TamB [Geobacter sp. DSM 9736]
MEATPPHKPRLQRRYVIIGILLLFVAGIYALIDIIFASPQAADFTERLLSRLLMKPVRVQSIQLSGATIRIAGLVIGNPAGFPKGRAASVRVLSVRPEWGALLLGKRSIRKIDVRGLNVIPMRNARGEWNVSLPPARDTAAPAGADVTIRYIDVKEMSLLIQGHGVREVSAQIRDISTAGSTVATFKVAGKAAGGKFRLEGSYRPGRDSHGDLVLDAGSLSLREIRIPASTLNLSHGIGNILVRGRLRGGVLQAETELRADHIKMQIGKSTVPLRGALGTTVRYDSRSDRLDIERFQVGINNLFKMTGNGHVLRLRTSRDFTVDLSTAPVSITAIRQYLPGTLRNDIAPAGMILPASLHLAGSGNRITAALGNVSLREAGASRSGTSIISGVSADVTASKTLAGIEVRGRLNQPEGNDLLRIRSAAFSGLISYRLRLLRLMVPEVSAQVSTASVTGSLTYDHADPAPFAANLHIAGAPLTLANRYINKGASFSSGTVTAEIDGAGRDSRSFAGKIRLSLREAEGYAGTHKFQVHTLTGDALIEADKEGVRASGDLKLDEAALAGKKIAASFGYAVSGRTFHLRDGMLRHDDLNLRFLEAGGALPLRNKEGYFPLQLMFSGVRGEQGSYSFREGAGSISAMLATEKPMLTGSAELTRLDLFMRKSEIASLAGRFTFTPQRSKADLTGDLLGGKSSASLTFDPFDATADATYAVDMKGVELQRLSLLFSRAGSAYPSGGRLDLSCDGRYNKRHGPSCLLSIAGSDITITGMGNRTLASGIGLTAEALLDGSKVTITKGSVATGNGVAATISGAVDGISSASPSGNFAFSVPVTPIDAIFDAAINMLPRKVQDATVKGTVAANAFIRLQGKKVNLDGTLAFADGRIEMPSQKLAVAAIDGTVPFSIAPSSPTVRRTPLTYGKQSYTLLLEGLRHPPPRLNTLNIGTLRFGPLDFGPMTMLLDARDGTISVASLHAPFAGGELLGRAGISPGSGTSYSLDLLVNDVSLRELCNAYPNIRGYLSGRVDGMMQLFSSGKGMEKMHGFVDLWTRESRQEKRLVSKEFLQKLAGQKLRGIFFRNDRPYDTGAIRASLDKGYLTFDLLDISHTNIFGVRDLSVSVAPIQNRISLDHLINAIGEAATRGRAVKGGAEPAPAETEFKWEE